MVINANDYRKHLYSDQILCQNERRNCCVEMIDGIFAFCVSYNLNTEMYGNFLFLHTAKNNVVSSLVGHICLKTRLN